MDKHLTEEEKKYYLKDIKKDVSFFRQSYRRAGLRVDIAGLDAEGAAEKIEALLAAHSAASRGAGSRQASVTAHDFDIQVRLAVFNFLERCVARHGDAVPRQVLAQGIASSTGSASPW